MLEESFILRLYLLMIFWNFLK